MRDRNAGLARDRHPVAGVGPERRTREELAPTRVVTRSRAARDVAALEACALREIALEVCGVQIGALDYATPAEPQHHPVVPEPAAPPCLPAIAHVSRPAGHDQVHGLAEELIARRERQAAVLHGDEVHGASRPEDTLPVGARLAPHTQPGHATVRVDVESHMRAACLALDREPVLGVAGERRSGQYLRECTIQRPEVFLGDGAAQRRAVDGTRRRMVAAEMVRIDRDGADRPGDTELDDAPIVPASGIAPAAGFPAVHPFAAIGVLALDELAAAGSEKIFLRREEFVAREERLTAEPRGSEVDQILVHHLFHLPVTPPGNAPASKTLTPRTNVCLTTPES